MLDQGHYDPFEGEKNVQTLGEALGHPNRHKCLNVSNLN